MKPRDFLERPISGTLSLDKFLAEHGDGKNPSRILQVKKNGHWAALHVDADGTVRLTTKQISRVTNEPGDNTKRLPHLVWDTDRLLRPEANMAGTLVLGEIVSFDGEFDSLKSVVGANPEKAIARQEAHGPVRFSAFDILYWQGQEIRYSPYLSRLETLYSFLDEYREGLCPVHTSLGATTSGDIAVEDYFGLVPMESTKDWHGFWNEAQRCGEEGIIIRDPTAIYGEGTIRVKEQMTFDVVVKAFTPGKGKYEGTTGAVVFGVYCRGILVKIGQCSGMDDYIRFGLGDSDHHRVFEVECQRPKVKDDGTVSFRHPRFNRWRDDVNKNTCTMEKLRGDAVEPILI